MLKLFDCNFKKFWYGSFLLLFLLASCKKEGDTAPVVGSRTAMLAGRWTFTASGTDSNGNGLLEVPEYDSLPPGYVGYATFNADGTATVSNTYFGRTLLTDNFRWVLANEDQQLLRLYEDGDTLIHYIKTFTPKRMEAYTKFSSGTEYFILEK